MYIREQPCNMVVTYGYSDGPMYAAVQCMYIINVYYVCVYYTHPQYVFKP